MNPIQTSMRQKLEKALAPLHLELENESHHHAHHHHNPKTHDETHFNLLVVSEKFKGLSRIDRQRLVANLFEEERSADQGQV